MGNVNVYASSSLEYVRWNNRAKFQGTGVFGNEAKDIAKLFKTCLSSSMCTTGSHQDFKKVVFAIGKDDSKKDIFTDVLLSN